ncbi:hypothetical protein [Nesterenkonia flava]|uniref:Uncharacterized protein n=1 Tax=Nesterenkonia flava TaxID=469799 RepID=A0ABU1FSC8_9MICC|nr:hypothetical protein [Nesterenkonia flava]MDR5711564.1 hypothetical protein [Nesterenkonia flava]
MPAVKVRGAGVVRVGEGAGAEDVGAEVGDGEEDGEGAAVRVGVGETEGEGAGDAEPGASVRTPAEGEGVTDCDEKVSEGAGEPTWAAAGGAAPKRSDAVSAKEAAAPMTACRAGVFFMGVPVIRARR